MKIKQEADKVIRLLFDFMPVAVAASFQYIVPESFFSAQKPLPGGVINSSRSFSSVDFAALSDPLGLGWNLFGTANAVWHPMLTSILAPAQTLALVGGLIWSARTAQKAANEVKVSSIPVIVYSLIVTSIMLWLLL